MSQPTRSQQLELSWLASRELSANYGTAYYGDAAVVPALPRFMKRGLALCESDPSFPSRTSLSDDHGDLTLAATASHRIAVQIHGRSRVVRILPHLRVER
jgi:hypothetical protein